MCGLAIMFELVVLCYSDHQSGSLAPPSFSQLLWWRGQRQSREPLGTKLSYPFVALIIHCHNACHTFEWVPLHNLLLVCALKRGKAASSLLKSI